MHDPRALQRSFEEQLRHEDVEGWLALWQTSQGLAARNRRLQLMAAALPFDPSDALAVLDMCCGPGDVGRFIYGRFPNARVDSLDRDPFLVALCSEINRARGIQTRAFLRDAWEPTWYEGLGDNYHVIASATALHWFDEGRLGELFGDFFHLLRDGGVVVFSEPVAAEVAFSAGHALWQREDEVISNVEGECWMRFWERAQSLTGYDHRPLLKAIPAGRTPIGDAGIPVLRYAELLRRAGFRDVDVLLRESTTATLAAMKRR